MRVLAIQAVRHFVGVRFADDLRAGIEQPLYCRCRCRGRRVRFEPRETAEAGFMPADVVKVLDAARETRERPIRGSRDLRMCVTAECAYHIALQHVLHACIVALPAVA